MKIYTKTGDEGETGLFGAPRVRKDAPRIEAYGTVDELNACLGAVRAEPLAADLDELLMQVQHELFDLGAELATPDTAKRSLPGLGPKQIEALEQAIDRYEEALPPLQQFILPGGCQAAAALHVARTVCRRAERRLVTLAAQEPISPTLVVYLNRLGDLLFVLARVANQRAGRPDTPWQKPTDRSAGR
jgi:cob(I)alamin adenosyltransferase